MCSRKLRLSPQHWRSTPAMRRAPREFTSRKGLHLHPGRHGMIERIGFIGTGTITEAIVTGLVAAPRELCEIWVSPRNQEIAARLSGRHALVHVGRDNQDVADRCDLLCLAVRPQIAEQVLSQLHLAPTHHILSFIATWNRERIAALM